MISAFGKILSSVSNAFDFNQATLSGCVDIIVVQQPDGSLKSTPFHVRFGKLKVLKTKEKDVSIHINNRESDLSMRLGDAGEGYFEETIVKPYKRGKLNQKMAEENFTEVDDENQTGISVNKIPKSFKDKKNQDRNWGNKESKEKEPIVIPDSDSDKGENSDTEKKEDGKKKKGKKREFIKSLFGKSKDKKKENEERKVDVASPLKPDPSQKNGNLKKFLDIKNSSSDAKASAETKAASNEDDNENIDEEGNQDTEIEISLCGSYAQGSNYTEVQDFFLQYKVSFEEFTQNPKIFLNNKNLMVRANETLYRYKEACKILINLQDSKPLLLDVPLEKTPKMNYLETSPERHSRSTSPVERRATSPLEKRDMFHDGRLRALTPQPKSTDFSMEIKSTGLLAQSAMIKGQAKDIKLGKTKLKKTLRPSSDSLLSLNLKPGMNTVTYKVRTSLQGHQTISGNIYLWPHDAKVVISDVDGTVTRSDFLGQVMPFVGRDWSQPGIAPLYTNIRRNGYYIMYLTSRAIGQSKQTKNFLQSVYQDGKMLPLGPVVMSPDRLMSSFKREVVFRRPEKFKIATLKDIKKLFPSGYKPFYAGFGNRITDSISYRAVGVSFEKIWIVNPQGNITQCNDDVITSYAMINSTVKETFPMVLRERVSLKSDKGKSITNTVRLDEEKIGDSNASQETSKNF